LDLSILLYPGPTSEIRFGDGQLFGYLFQSKNSILLPCEPILLLSQDAHKLFKGLRLNIGSFEVSLVLELLFNIISIYDLSAFKSNLSFVSSLNLANSSMV